jgi:hypothetical protein
MGSGSGPAKMVLTRPDLAPGQCIAASENIINVDSNPTGKYSRPKLSAGISAAAKRALEKKFWLGNQKLNGLASDNMDPIQVFRDQERYESYDDISGVLLGKYQVIDVNYLLIKFLSVRQCPERGFLIPICDYADNQHQH